FGTTNSQNGYLRDITGNRRFWTVRTPGSGRMKPWQLTRDDVNQIWAEVLVLVDNGEKLYLDSDLETYSQVEQASAMEQDDREGLVNAYLDLLLPETWDSMDIYARQEFVRDPDSPVQPKGVVKRDRVSNMEIWCECFGKRKEDIKPFDSYAIAAIMLRIEGWRKTDERDYQPVYGRQRLYRRQ
ncbi:MAG: VapE family protein, partial [Bacillota bacterium]|nr:VapE family protein [Bacillota bacterium]